MSVLLVGNPNAGKSTLFNRLTRGHARVGNWHGVTVGALEGEAKLAGRRVKIVDLPGIYSAKGVSMEEKLACDYLEAHPADALLFVAECETFPRVLPLAAALTAGGRRAGIALTKRRRFGRLGGQIDPSALGSRLGVPVFFAESRDLGRHISDILDAPPRAIPRVPLSDALYRPVREGLSRADSLLLNGAFGIPFFFLLLLAAFFVTFAEGMPGALMKEGVERLFTDVLGGYARRIASPVVRSLLADGLLPGLGSVLSILPQIMLLYLALILLEESGLFSRFAILTDGLFSRLGLNGRAAFSLLMGFGCTAAAILTTRGLDDKRMQRRVILCLPYISCSAKLPVYLALSASLFPEPFLAVAGMYALGVAMSFLVALLLKGAPPPFVLELAPLQLPRPLFVAKSLLFQLKQFIIKVATVILAFFLASWLLSSFDFSFRLVAAEGSMLAAVCGGLGFLFAPAGMNDWRITYAALSGLIAKENVAGAIAMFYGAFPYGRASAFAFAVFILACSPCVSAIAAAAREVGAGRALLYAALQTASALLLSYLAYFCARGGAVYLAIAAAPVVALVIMGKNFEKLSRSGKRHSSRLHRRA